MAPPLQERTPLAPPPAPASVRPPGSPPQASDSRTAVAITSGMSPEAMRPFDSPMSPDDVRQSCLEEVFHGDAALASEYGPAPPGSTSLGVGGLGASFCGVVGSTFGASLGAFGGGASSYGLSAAPYVPRHQQPPPSVPVQQRYPPGQPPAMPVLGGRGDSWPQQHGIFGSHASAAVGAGTRYQFGAPQTTIIGPALSPPSTHHTTAAHGGPHGGLQSGLQPKGSPQLPPGTQLQQPMQRQYMMSYR